MSKIPARRHRLAALAAVAAVLVIAACSSSSSPTSPSAAVGPASTQSAASTTLAGIDHADAQIAKYSSRTNAIPAPGPSIRGISAVKGRTITYIPLFLLSPYFEAVSSQLAKSAAVAGMTVKVCNGNATPTGVASCFSQAIAAKTAGIITDAVPYSYASNPYAAAVKARIPVVALDITDQPPKALGAHAVTLPEDTNLDGQLVADSIIANSRGKADALLVVSTYNAQSTENKNAMEQEFSRYCPGCHVTEVIVNESSQITGVNLALTKEPGINYVVAQQDQPVGPIVQGVLKQLNKHLVTASQGGSLNGMEAVQAGTNLSDVGNDPATSAWGATDLLLRLMTHNPVPPLSNYTPVIRVFTKSNIGTVTLSSSAFSDGSWYSNDGFQAMYTALWTATKAG